MKTLIATLVAQRKNHRVIVTALLTAGTFGGWIMSAMFTPTGTAFGVSSRLEMTRENDSKKLPLEASKPGLIGSYVVTGTDSNGKPYAGASIVDISLAPSGALELHWDNASR
jgi:hypothetical protein